MGLKLVEGNWIKSAASGDSFSRSRRFGNGRIGLSGNSADIVSGGIFANFGLIVAIFQVGQVASILIQHDSMQRGKNYGVPAYQRKDPW